MRLLGVIVVLAGWALAVADGDVERVGWRKPQRHEGDCVGLA